jgi:hypothetical protein
MRMGEKKPFFAHSAGLPERGGRSGHAAGHGNFSVTSAHY